MHAIWKSRNSNGKAKVTAVNISVLLLVQRLPSTSENKTVACGDLFPVNARSNFCTVICANEAIAAWLHA